MEKTLENTSALLTPLVKFRQTIARKEYLKLSADLVYDIINNPNQISVNALSEHFLRVEAMSNCLEFIEGYDIDTWSELADYDAGDQVKKVINDREYVWTAVLPSGALDPQDPETDITFTYWESYLSTRLREYAESSAKETISQAISESAAHKYSEELSAVDVIYKETTTYRQTQKEGRFVGVEICTKTSKLNRMLEVDKIFLNVTDITPFNIYLYHSSVQAPVAIFPMDSLVANTAKWYDLVDANGDTLSIDLYSDKYNQGGKFYIGFYEDDIVGEYSNNELLQPQNLLNSTKHFTFQSIEIDSNNLNGSNLPTLGEYYDLADWNDELPFNFRYKEMQSYYPLIADNIKVFQKVYQHTLAINILRDMMMSNRVNEVSDNAQAKIDELLYGADGNENNKGLVEKAQTYTKKLMSDLSAIQDDYEGMVTSTF